MKNIKYMVLTVSCLMMAMISCTKEELETSANKEFVFLDVEETDLFFERETGVTTNAGIRVVVHSKERAISTNYTFEILESSTAIEDVHYRVNATSGVIAPNSVIDTLPIEIISENLIPCQQLSLNVKLVSSDIERTDLGTLELSINLESSSELAGIVNYTHTENFAGEDITGMVEISSLQDPGDYMLTDFSFGAWPTAYGIDPPTGNLRWNNNCSTIRLSGTDNYGDVWQMDEVLESDGAVFSFRWSNTYGEFGLVSLTRQDGNSWPKLEL